MDSDQHVFQINTGTLEYCFQNLNVNDQVKVWFYLLLPTESNDSITHKALTDAKVLSSKIVEMTNSIYRWSHQTRRHASHIQERKKSIIHSSFFICIVIIFTGVLQVLLIRALFKKYR